MDSYCVFLKMFQCDFIFLSIVKIKYILRIICFVLLNFYSADKPKIPSPLSCETNASTSASEFIDTG